MYWGIYEVHVFPYLRACDTEEYGLQSKEPDLLHVSAQLLMLSFLHERYDEILTNTPLILCTLSTPILCCQRLDGIVNSILDPSNLLKKRSFSNGKHLEILGIF